VTHRTTFAPEKIQFYATAAYPCSYMPGRIARSQVAVPSTLLHTQAYSQLVQKGFRRSGEFIYRPHCDHCQACTSIRVPVAGFSPSRSQKRAWARHCNLVVQLSRPFFSEAHFALYQRYQKARHTGGGMDHDDVEQYNEFLVSTQVNSWLIEFREPANGDNPGQLKMVSIIDRLHDGLSAVYTFFEPDEGQAYGTFNVLWQIAHAKFLELPFVYLGYWIHYCQKMDYKLKFKPNELLINGMWTKPDPKAIQNLSYFIK
jgi:arginine-tRNA-protein transferase